VCVTVCTLRLPVYYVHYDVSFDSITVSNCLVQDVKAKQGRDEWSEL